MVEVWGSVDGDTNAQAIISDRAGEKKAGYWTGLVSGLALIGCLVWFGMTGSQAALAWSIIAAVWTINARVGQELHSTHTFVMIAERRAQLLEQQVQELRAQVAELNRRSF